VPASCAALQPRPLTIVCLGLQPGQLATSAGLAETGATLVAEDDAGEADQDRGQSGVTLEVCGIPTGLRVGHAELVRGDPRPRRAVGDAAASRRRPDACVGVSSWRPEKTDLWGKVCALRAPHADKLACRRMIPVTRIKKPRRLWEKRRRIRRALDAGWGTCCYNHRYCKAGSSPGSVQLGNVGQPQLAEQPRR
jgi:hypothetical protein